MDAIEAVVEKATYEIPTTTKQHNKSKAVQYMKKDVELGETPLLFFPKGKEMLFLFIYFLTLPYIVGLLFLFFYISNMQVSIFQAVGMDTSIFFVWMIGYEIIAVIVILNIIKNAIKLAISERAQ
ncbi:hypothetical protein MNB_SV-4-277 [hydrothermal vent metagenome]|uniref:Uncharacterized protein n=1 Tax=hydrothermal vent metagenome TaxID=652676 RepID=A0A1W1E8A8_9ZZZZ